MLDPNTFARKVHQEFIPKLAATMKKKYKADVVVTNTQWGIDVLIDGPTGWQRFCINPFENSWLVVHGN